MFVNIRARFHFALIGGNLTAQSTFTPRRGATGQFEAEFKFQRHGWKLSVLFLAPPPELPGELARRLVGNKTNFATDREKKNTD